MAVDYSKLTKEQVTILHNYLLLRSIDYAKRALGEHLMINNLWQYQGVIDGGLKRYKCSNGKSAKVVNFVRNIYTSEIKRVSTNDLNYMSSNHHSLGLSYKFIMEDLDVIVNARVEIAKQYLEFMRENDFSFIYKTAWTQIEDQLNFGLGLTTYQIEIIEKSMFCKKSILEYQEYAEKHPEFESKLILLQLGTNNDIPIRLRDKIQSIIQYYQTHTFLTKAQIVTINRLCDRDFEKINDLFTKLENNLSQLSRNTVSFIRELKNQYGETGLTDKQIAALERIYNKLKDEEIAIC